MAACARCVRARGRTRRRVAWCTTLQAAVFAEEVQHALSAGAKALRASRGCVLEYVAGPGWPMGHVCKRRLSTEHVGPGSVRPMLLVDCCARVCILPALVARNWRLVAGCRRCSRTLHPAFKGNGSHRDWG